jgi:hypothetical protein
VSQFVVFQLYATVPAMPASLAAWLVEADDAHDAANVIVGLGIFTSGTVYALDMTAAAAFDITINPDVTPSGEDALPLTLGDPAA